MVFQHNQSLQQTKPPVTSPACAGAAPAVFAAEAGVRSIGGHLNRIILVAAVIAALVPTAAPGQAVSIEYDVNTPAYSKSLSEEAHDLDLVHRLSMRAGYLSKRYAGCEQTHRWSIFVGHQALETNWPYTTSFSAFSIEAGFDWLVLERSWIGLSFGGSAGPAIFSHESRYLGLPMANENFPDGGLIFSGFGRCEIPVSSKLGVVLGARGWLLAPGREDMFPFKAGPILSVGILLS